MNKKISFYTLGCRANQYDTEMMKEKLKVKYQIVPFGPESDIYIINTCTVTGKADSKSRKYIRKASRWGGLVLVTGCYPVLDREEIEEIDGVDFVLTNRNKNNILEILRERNENNGENLGKSWSLNEQKISRDTRHTRAFLKIQDGCDKDCSYCKIKYVRGPSRSKSRKNVKKEVDSLLENGYPEIVLTGIDLADYGESKKDLPRLLKELSNKKGLERLRLSSINIDGITPEIIEVFKEEKELCPHFHIPLQSGSDKILRSMRRGYKASKYLETIQNLKTNLRGVTFGTDIMIGFPGEKEEDVEKTEKILKEIVYINYHLFPFSPRNYTDASSLPGQIPYETKKKREKRLKEIGSKKAKEEKEKFIGSKRELILEEESSKTGYWRGYTKNYIDVHIPSLPKKYEREGNILEVKIEKVEYSHCVGSMLT